MKFKDTFRKMAGLLSMGVLAASALASCGEESTGWDISQVPDDPAPKPAPTTVKKAPLYWTVYEFCYEAEHFDTDRNMPKATWEKNLQFVAEQLKPYGYDMVCTDGFMTMSSDINTDPSGYMTHYGVWSLKELIAYCSKLGLKVGVYDNPLWIHGPLDTKVEGTNIPFSNLMYDPGVDKVKNPNAEGDIFQWVVPSHQGAKEYIDGFFKYYKNLGVEFIRMDFMCLFEDGGGISDSNPGRGYGRTEYELALKYIRESSQKYGVIASIVMPNCFNDAELESQYGDMFRVDADTFNGTFAHVNGLNGSDWVVYDQQTFYRPRGKFSDRWPKAFNMFDGLVAWSHLSGRGKVILDADFTRLGTLASDAEREFCISLQLMAGAPVAAADQFNSEGIDHNVQFYQNTEMLALNTDGFVGQPVSDDVTKTDSQIWYGQMTDGSWVVGLFNREETKEIRSVSLSKLGISGTKKMRDLWRHTDEGETSTVVSAELEPHSCKIIKLTD